MPGPPKEVPAINTYGFRHMEGATQFDYDCVAYIKRLPFERTGLTRAQLYRRVSDLVIPGYHEWHPWTQRQIEVLSSERWIGFAGCANSAKTHNVAGFATAWWAMRPNQSSVILCSTTRHALRRRGWANIQRCYTAMGLNQIGNMVDSRMVWQCERGDDKHSILGIAVEDGETAKVADNIRGHKAERQLVIVDEATSVPTAIMEAIENLWSYPSSQPDGEFILILIGNPQDRNDQHGRFCEPLKGWASVNVESEEWESKKKWDGKPGYVLRFDAFKSPNLTQGTIISRHLPTREMVKEAISREGSDTSPAVWSNLRGFWPPEGFVSSVFTGSMFQTHHAYDPVVWTGRTTLYAGFDPSFSQGGDRAILRVIRCGPTHGGEVAQLLPKIIIPVNAQDSRPISYQLVEGVRKACERMGVVRENLCVDATGEGGTFCDIITQEWGPGFLRVENSWSPTERPVSHEDHRLSKEVYYSRGCELWFQMRAYLFAGQIRGMDHELEREACARLYEPEVGTTKKRKLEKKLDMRKRVGFSPDDADSTTLAFEAARSRGWQIQPLGLTAARFEQAAREDEMAADVLTGSLHSPENSQEVVEEMFGVYQQEYA